MERYKRCRECISFAKRCVLISGYAVAMFLVAVSPRPLEKVFAQIFSVVQERLNGEM